ncbi:MAG TPA: polysaccharide biosynthesis/export family protein [Bryobacteraceae bacterium]|nr:polysaccharide biosynthesis/export family protein [Bryobacteraceae bacterium]
MLTALAAAILCAQERTGHLDAGPSTAESALPQGTHTESAPSSYILGPDDQVTLFVYDIEEISDKPMRIDMRGNLTLPLAGRLHAAGLTAGQLEAAIETPLRKFLKDPEVVVSITEFRSQPVSVLGAVTTPGVHQLEGHKTLFEILSMAGGLRSDAGNTVRITRNLEWGEIPLPDAKNDSTGQFSVASVSSKSVIDATDPVENITIKPHDVISVSKADLVYCVGSVNKPGGFVLGQKESMSALQVLSLAEGLNKTAAPDKAKIMRAVAGSPNRTEIAIDIKALMAGKAPDLPLRSDDILFIPNSAARSMAARTAEAAIQVATGVAIYGRY